MVHLLIQDESLAVRYAISESACPKISLATEKKLSSLRVECRPLTGLQFKTTCDIPQGDEKPKERAELVLCKL
jgi:hypothetical protein